MNRKLQPHSTIPVSNTTRNTYPPCFIYARAAFVDVDYADCLTPHVAALAPQALRASLARTLALFPGPAQHFVVSSVGSCGVKMPRAHREQIMNELILRRIQSDRCILSTILASQPHSVPQRRSLSVSARGGRVWRLRTTLREQLERNYWVSHA